MAEIIRVVVLGTKTSNATYRVQCDGCPRVYETTASREQIRRTRYCMHCRPYTGGRGRRRLAAASAEASS